MNATMSRFGYPGTLVREYAHWVVLLRDKQVTLGSLVMICMDKAMRLPEISVEAFSEMKEITRDLEAALGAAFSADKFNYIMLMMVDPDVHFHVVPRYAGPRNFANLKFIDPGWPKLPDLQHVHDMSLEAFESLRVHLAKAWPVSTSSTD